MTIKLLIALLSIFASGKATAFLSVSEQRRINNLQSLPYDHNTNTKLFMMNDIATAVPSTLQDLNPDMTAEMMTDMSHVALDLTGFMRLSQSHILAFSILGRLLVLYTDFLPGHSVPPEELAVQTFLLANNLKDLVKVIAEDRRSII